MSNNERVNIVNKSCYIILPVQVKEAVEVLDDHQAGRCGLHPH